MKLPFLETEMDDAALETGRKLFAGETDFLKGVVAMSG
ncbi:MAG: YihA family ribosome biogenesis GTP-binding protein, partial [Pseudomonadota bacterium]